MSSCVLTAVLLAESADAGQMAATFVAGTQCPLLGPKDSNSLSADSCSPICHTLFSCWFMCCNHCSAGPIGVAERAKAAIVACLMCDAAATGVQWIYDMELLAQLQQQRQQVCLKYEEKKPGIQAGCGAL